ncbi:MAG: hypothetical protein NT001_06835 [Candidatus Woesearchaeota archaeon]|nr:hypothetical protein [Candidatus Woesearchaeota archaeon]
MCIWPFKKKVKPDYGRLEKEDKELKSQEDLDKMDSEFTDESCELITKVLKKQKKL